MRAAGLEYMKGRVGVTLLKLKTWIFEYRSVVKLSEAILIVAKKIVPRKRIGKISAF